MLPFLSAVFLSAFLLFLIQPLMGRFVLPWFGGSPAVWTACLLFFQTALLLGYAYAHALSRWSSIRRQALLHGALLLGALFWLSPVPTRPEHDSSLSDSPLGQVVLLLFRAIGPSFVLLAATGPLFQHWFSKAFPDRSPYRLYALSNAGSLLALLSYPTIVEPNLPRAYQATLWSALWVTFALIAGVLIVRLQRVRPPAESLFSTKENHPSDPPIDGLRQFHWIAWSAIASGLLAASTNALTLDVAAVPFLWILPLAIYLLSFIVTFDHSRWYRRPVFLFLLPVAAAASLGVRTWGTSLPLGPLITLHLAALTVGGIVCHGELYRSRPGAGQLTRFYLSIATGGALGTLLVARLSPALLSRNVDLPLLWLALLLLVVLGIVASRERPTARWLIGGQGVAFLLIPMLHPSATGWIHNLGVAMRENALILLVAMVVSLPLCIPWTAKPLDRKGILFTPALIVLALLLGWKTLVSAWTPEPGIVATQRSFFGDIKVVDYPTSDARGASRFMAHGNTTHGIQLRHPDYRRYPTSYYSINSGIGRAFTRSNQSRDRRIRVIGLGVGTVASYGMAGDHIRFYEIDAHVATLAEEHFTFIQDSPAAIDVRIGDGRRLVEWENQEGNHPRLDLLIVDAFSSDGVPVHLLTREAMAAYVARLATDGVIVVNISNRLVDLRPVLEAHAAHFGLHLARIINQPEVDDWWDFASEWILLAPRRESLDTPRITEKTDILSPEEMTGLPWTDEYASVWSVLRQR